LLACDSVSMASRSARSARVHAILGDLPVPPAAHAAGDVYKACREHAAWKLNHTLAIGFASCDGDEAVSRLLHEGTIGGGLTRGGAWALRAVETSAKSELQDVRAENDRTQRLTSFVRRTKTLPDDGHGDWYFCDELPRELSCTELHHFIELAKQHPDDVKAQITACMAIVRAALHHGPAKAARLAVAKKDGLEAAVAAMHLHRSSELLQQRGCDALWRISDTVEGARAAEVQGATEVVMAAMIRFRGSEHMQLAGCGFLANHCRHQDQGAPGPLLLNAVEVVATAMGNYPRNADLQRYGSAFLWQLATESPAAVAGHPGMQYVVEHAASRGAKEAKMLLECIQWRSTPEHHASRGGSRQRWGQWAAGRNAAV